MKKILMAVAVMAVAASSAHAVDWFEHDPKGNIAECRVVSGAYDNSTITPGRIYMETAEGYPFAIVVAERLTIENILGMDTVFLAKSLSISGGTKIDFVSENTSKPVQAIMLISRVPGQIQNKFSGLLIITGVNIDVTMAGGSFLGEKSLVYNLKCEAE
ncbi:MAG: hypothetical protein L6420_09700 [Elusimicrobia bacterium]|nr:hypothetical protein [Elusimicrobiota bacterium]